MEFPLRGVVCLFILGLIVKNIHGNSCSIIDVINDPCGFTYDEINAVIGEHESKVLYSSLYKNSLRKKSRTIWIKDVIKDVNAKKYIFELSDDKFVETVCIKRNTGMKLFAWYSSIPRYPRSASSGIDSLVPFPKVSLYTLKSCSLSLASCTSMIF
jgi:hypothetical protein